MRHNEQKIKLLWKQAHLLLRFDLVIQNGNLCQQGRFLCCELGRDRGIASPLLDFLPDRHLAKSSERLVRVGFERVVVDRKVTIFSQPIHTGETKAQKTKHRSLIIRSILQ